MNIKNLDGSPPSQPPYFKANFENLPHCLHKNIDRFVGLSDAPPAPTGQPRMLRYKLCSCGGNFAAKARAPGSPMPQPRKANCKWRKLPWRITYTTYRAYP